VKQQHPLADVKKKLRSDQMRRQFAVRRFPSAKARAAAEAEFNVRLEAQLRLEAEEAKTTEQAQLNAPTKFGGRPRQLLEPKHPTLLTLFVRHVEWLDAQAERLKVSRAEVVRQLIEAAMQGVAS
jgi:hypothetical protein